MPAAVEILPSGTLFEPGESLRLVIQGTDVKRYPKEKVLVYFRHESIVNQGWHEIFGGGDRASYLVIPVLPTA